MISCTTLTPDERALLQAQLEAAQTAYHTLSIGGAARVIVDQNGERVEFQTANRGTLLNYIMSLKAQLGMLTPGCGGMPARPATFLF